MPQLTTSASCPQCFGSVLEMRWGERPKGYYFHCLACAKNWRPDQTCPGCGRREVRLRKSKGIMLLECAGCGYAGVFHRNPWRPARSSASGWPFLPCDAGSLAFEACT